MEEPGNVAVPEESPRRHSSRRRSGGREALRAKRKLQRQKRLAWIVVGFIIVGFIMFSGRFFE